MAEPPPSVAALLARLDAERIRALEALTAMLERLQLEGVPRSSPRPSIRSSDRSWPASAPASSPASGCASACSTCVRAGAAARQQATPESLHRARIGNKRLRYAIEPFSRMLGKEVRRLYRSASRFHDVLGDVHDADSMAVMLETAMVRAPKPERRVWEGLAVKVIRDAVVALRRAFSLADRIEPLWDEAQRSVEEPWREAAPRTPAPLSSS